MCSWLILLFLLFRCNNGCDMCCDNDRNDNNRNRRSDSDCDRNRRNDNDCDCDRRSDRSWERSSSCGCEDEFVQPRSFGGFQNQGTCGCETKEE